jgi:hypothetical protein
MSKQLNVKVKVKVGYGGVQNKENGLMQQKKYNLIKLAF